MRISSPPTHTHRQLRRLRLLSHVTVVVSARQQERKINVRRLTWEGEGVGVGCVKGIFSLFS